MVIIMVTCGAALLLSGVAIIVSDTILFRGYLRRDLEALAQIVADNTTAALAFENARDAQEILASLRARRNLVQACIYTADSRVFARYVRPGGPTECPQTVDADSKRITRDALFLFHSILLQDRKVGSLYFHYEFGEVAARQTLYLILVGAIAAASMLLALILSTRLRLLISQPIMALAASAKAVSETKDYGVRAEKSTQDEVGLLVDAFNDMLANIQQRDVDLRKARDELEVRVTERTAQLQQELVMRKRAEASLQKQAEELARSNTDLEQFAYVASHDLQEPLRMVTTFMRILKNRYYGKLDAEADEYITYAVDGASRMKQLITDLLALSRASTKPHELAPIDCEAVLEEVLSNLEMAVQESGGQVTHDPLPRVMADRSQMVQLLQNLIGNAIKFAGTRAPRVHISVKQMGKEWLFSVRDHGIGISPEHRERIFIVFQRLHDRTEYPGTGVGLAICKKIVERHGGRIWVESQRGEGATFCFTIPVQIMESREETPIEYSNEKAST